MSDLILIIGLNMDAAWEWGLTATGEAGRVETQAEKEALSSKSFRRVIAVIPGQQVVTKLHTLGQLNSKQIRQAAGFSIEDELGASLNDSHIALDDDNKLAVTSHLVLANIIADITAAGLSPDIICADYDSFAVADRFTYEDRIIQRSSNGLGFAVETNLATTVLDAGQTIPPIIDSTRFLQKIAAALTAGHMPMNLRQGQYAKRDLADIGHYKRSALLVAAIAIAFMVSTLLQGYNTGRKTATLKSQMNDIYVAKFPQSGVPDNPALAFIRAQADLKKGNKQVFVQLSALLAQSIKGVNGAEVSSLRYEATKSQLSLSINYSSFDDVEKLKNAATNYGGIFTESGTRQNGDGLSGDAVLRLKP